MLVLNFVFNALLPLLQREEVNTLEEAIASAASLSGPCEKSIEPVLQQHNIQRQSYHGGAFIGNHVNHALKKAVREAITNAPLHVSNERCSILTDKASVVAKRYLTLFEQYAACREIFSLASAVTEDQAQQLERSVARFMSTVRREIVARKRGNITPKLHMLEGHAVVAVRRFGVGLGLLGEHGAESIHAHFNDLRRTFDSILDELKLFQTIVKQHCLRTLPKHLCQTPTPYRRQRAPKSA